MSLVNFFWTPIRTPMFGLGAKALVFLGLGARDFVIFGLEELFLAG